MPFILEVMLENSLNKASNLTWCGLRSSTHNFAYSCSHYHDLQPSTDELSEMNECITAYFYSRALFIYTTYLRFWGKNN